MRICLAGMVLVSVVGTAFLVLAMRANGWDTWDDNEDDEDQK